MAKKFTGKPIMAGSVPHGLNEPAYVSMYKGCSIWSYNDSEGALRLVMLDSDDNVKHGTKEAYRLSNKVGMEERYNLNLVREIG